MSGGGQSRLEEIRCLDCGSKFIWVYGTPEYCSMCLGIMEALSNVNTRDGFIRVTGSNPEDLLSKFFTLETWNKFRVTRFYPRLVRKDVALLQAAWRVLDPHFIQDWGAIARAKVLGQLTGLIVKAQTEQPAIKAEYMTKKAS